MPAPIRPVREIERNVPAVLTDGGGSVMGLSALQQQMIGGGAPVEAQRRHSAVDARDVDLLHQIWLEQEDEDVVVEASEARGIISVAVAENVPDYDLLRLKANGLAIGAGRSITLTSKGSKVLKDKILLHESDIQLNREREKLEVKEASGRKLRVVNGG